MHAHQVPGISRPVVAVLNSGRKVLLVPKNFVAPRFSWVMEPYEPICEEPNTTELPPSLLTTPAECFDAAWRRLANSTWSYVCRLTKKLYNLVYKRT